MDPSRVIVGYAAADKKSFVRSNDFGVDLLFLFFL